MILKSNNMEVKKLTPEDKNYNIGMRYMTIINEDRRMYTQKAFEELYRKIGESLTPQQALPTDEKEIYCMHDPRDGEILCAFDDKDRANIEKEESGAPYQVVKLYHGKRKG